MSLFAQQTNELPVFTCSVYPDLTRLWYTVLSRTFNASPPPGLIFDCGGALRPEWFPGAEVRRMPNWEHGRKIDLALQELHGRDLVLILDDDAFPLSKAGIDKAAEALRANDRMAAYTFHARDWWKVPVNGALHVPMGSYALLVKRDAIQREGLSFRARKTSDPGIRNGTGYWDTADYCQMQLVERGYTIGYAPPEDQAEIPTFFGASGGFLTFARRSLLRRNYVRRWNRRRSAKEALASNYAFQRACSIAAIADAHRRLVGGPPSFDDWFGESELRHLAETASGGVDSQQYLATADRVFGIRDRLLAA